MDHTQILGDTIDKIAYEKAGIIKEGIPVVMFPQQKQSEEVIERVCRERNCKLIKVPQNSSLYLGKENLQQAAMTSMEGTVYTSNKVITQKMKVQTLNNDYIIDLALLGKHQLLNCSVASSCYEELIEPRC